jgi:hypothetical protein
VIPLKTQILPNEPIFSNPPEKPKNYQTNPFKEGKIRYAGLFEAGPETLRRARAIYSLDFFKTTH